MTQAIPTDAIQYDGTQCEGSYVYFLMRDGVCVYVGQTGNLKQRLYGHTDKRYDRVTFIHVSEDVRLSMEADFIDRIEPEYNGTIWPTAEYVNRKTPGTISHQLFDIVVDAAETLGSVNKLCVVAGVPQASVSAWLACAQPHLSGATIDKLCEYLNIRIARRKARQT